jgi:VWFA-related protein
MDRSVRIGFAVLALGVLLTAALTASRQDAATSQTFRGGVDLIRLDVSVLDRHRNPVSGLTAADFSVIEDGQPRPIATFAAVELPPPVQPTASWMNAVAPDVTTNAHVGGHALVILIDDGSLDGLGKFWGVLKTRVLARAALDEMGPEDVAAVVFTTNNYAGQDFTSDRRLLLAAIDGAALFPQATAHDIGGDIVQDNAGQHGGCYCGECSPGAIETVAESLRPLTQQRKTILYLGAGQAIPQGHTPTGPCNVRLIEKVDKAIHQAQLSNITVHAINPNGLCGDCGVGNEFLRTVAESTGGRAVVNDNDPELEIPSIFAETRSYYLLGFVPAPTNQPGKFHPINVRVKREGVDVRAREGYYTPTEKERRTMEARAASVDGTIDTALPGTGVPLAVSVAALLDPTRPTPMTAIVLNVSQPIEGASRGLRRERVDVVASAIRQDSGKIVGTERQSLDIAWSPGDTFAAQYEVLSRMPLPPGRYELRVGVKSPERNGSVYAYVDVPNFAKQALAASGLVVSAMPTPKAAPANAFSGVLPVVPTARRDFSARDRVSVFLRIYQQNSKAPLPVGVTMHVEDAYNHSVLAAKETLLPDAFRGGKTADYRATVPVERLPEGEYLMTIDVDNGATTLKRTMRFRVRS